MWESWTLPQGLEENHEKDSSVLCHHHVLPGSYPALQFCSDCATSLDSAGWDPGQRQELSSPQELLTCSLLRQPQPASLQFLWHFEKRANSLAPYWGWNPLSWRWNISDFVVKTHNDIWNIRRQISKRKQTKRLHHVIDTLCGSCWIFAKGNYVSFVM